MLMATGTPIALSPGKCRDGKAYRIRPERRLDRDGDVRRVGTSRTWQDARLALRWKRSLERRSDGDLVFEVLHAAARLPGAILPSAAQPDRDR
jgi:hypothetical protein